MENNVQIDSCVNLDNRNTLKITGVQKVFYSTQTESLLLTSYGKLLISGNNINVKKVALEQNIVELDGKFDAIKYTNSSKQTNKKLFGLFKRG